MTLVLSVSKIKCMAWVCVWWGEGELHCSLQWCRCSPQCTEEGTEVRGGGCEAGVHVGAGLLHLAEG